MAAFIAHPSVRMKGTEHNYNPVLCQDETCSAKAKESHMHCPFCSITEAYQDPVILRAHYRVKHVDKGIDFAGLKVLRCCNHCEIVGTIKGEKKFKGAHWHCYRCRNGFNRRDEAIKHYKTHFRNPHTTFQIQITQEVNSRQYYDQSAEAHPKAYSGLAIGGGSNGDYSTIGPVLTQTIISTSAGTDALLTEGPKDSSVSNGITVGAEETVGLSQQATGQQTLVLMDPDGETGNLIYDTAAGIITEQGGESMEHSILLEKQFLELHQQHQVLYAEKAAMEKRLRAEIQRLKDHMASLVQANVKMFEELQLYRTSESSEQKIKILVENLEAQHRELLQTQLGTLRRELLNQAGTLPVSGQAEGLQLSLPPAVEEGESAMGVSFLSEDQTSRPDSQSPALSGLDSQPPALSGLGSQPPALSGLDSQSPALSGLDSQPPALTGLDSQPPALSGLDSQPPALTGLDSQPPALSGLDIVEVQLQHDQVDTEPKMESPVPITSAVYSVEVLDGEQDVLLAKKRSPEAAPQEEENSKRQRSA